MGQTIRSLVAGLATAVALAGFVNLAAAHETATGSTHAMDFTPDVASDLFAGQVSSTKDLCERGRSITLHRVVGDASVPDQEVSTATTGPSGLWSKGVGDAQAGTYYAKAARKVVRSSRHRHVCRAATTTHLSISPVLEALSLDPGEIGVGGQSTGTVSLSVSTAEDLTVTLESSDASVAALPAAVTVGAGQQRALFRISGTAAGSTEIRASLNGTSATGALTVNNP